MNNEIETTEPETTKEKPDFGTGVFVTLLFLTLVGIILMASNSIYDQYKVVKVVRDTIYVHDYYEVEIKGPQKYTDYINKNHPLNLTTSDGTYHIKLIENQRP